MKLCTEALEKYVAKKSAETNCKKRKHGSFSGKKKILKQYPESDLGSHTKLMSHL